MPCDMQPHLEKLRPTVWMGPPCTASAALAISISLREERKRRSNQSRASDTGLLRFARNDGNEETHAKTKTAAGIAADGCSRKISAPLTSDT
jgi:hypothetical protein